MVKKRKINSQWHWSHVEYVNRVQVYRVWYDYNIVYHVAIFWRKRFLFQSKIDILFLLKTPPGQGLGKYEWLKQKYFFRKAYLAWPKNI